MADKPAKDEKKDVESYAAEGEQVKPGFGRRVWIGIKGYFSWLWQSLKAPAKVTNGPAAAGIVNIIVLALFYTFTLNETIVVALQTQARTTGGKAPFIVGWRILAYTFVAIIVGMFVTFIGTYLVKRYAIGIQEGFLAYINRVFHYSNWMMVLSLLLAVCSLVSPQISQYITIANSLLLTLAVLFFMVGIIASITENKDDSRMDRIFATMIAVVIFVVVYVILNGMLGGILQGFNQMMMQ
ncbi:hypothetical protein ACI3E1_05275 [Ligilactobacillus sp. LYQ139]|uniref:hypothetical protein n=1 Tax=Ligilactobacillus sp. LYQ139 TaxID=3378800 RepID=UPI003853D380